MLPEMDVTKLTDDELIEQCESIGPKFLIDDEIAMLFFELLRRLKQYRAFTKIPEAFIEQAGRLNIDSNNWCVLLDGTTTVGAWQRMEACAYKKQNSGIVPYKHGWYGCQNGVFCFSETGRFAPLITVDQFIKHAIWLELDKPNTLT